MTGPDKRRLPAWLAATLAIAAALQLALVDWWPGFASPNERTRAYQAIAVVDRGSLAIDAESARFGAMEDVARGAAGDPRTYPNKAPGLLPLLLPGAWLAHAVAHGQPERQLEWTLQLGRLSAASLPFLAALVLLARLTAPSAPHAGRFVVASYALATPALAASALLFSHAFTAFALLAAYALLFRRREVPPRDAAVAGFLLAWAVAAEYTVAVPAAVVALLALPRLGWRGAAAGIAGAVPPAALLAAYDAACFGSPFSLSTAHEAHAPVAALVAHGLFGIGWPGLAGLFGLLLSPTRGLLVWAPVAVLALWPPAPRRPEAVPGARAAAALAPLALLLLFSGYPNWHGGWFPGPRYLLPALPLLFVAAAPGIERALAIAWGRTLATAAALWGCAAAFLSLATFPFPPEDFPLPWLSLGLPLLRDGVVAPSWLPAPVALVLLTGLTVASIALLAVLAAGRDTRRALAGVALGGAALLLTLRTPPPPTWRGRLEAAVIHDVYAGGVPGALERLLGAGATEAERAQ
ncbi:MAG TPA: hypothetical protein VLW17_01320, partial [Thermoanaerobaculaceae bacterium]|nr:hypothetical protein [Thermoanaerobaculaceae bacterium]